MNANETCEDSIHGPYEPDDVADHCGGCGIPLCEEHARKCPCCGRVNCTDCGEICEACCVWYAVSTPKWNPRIRAIRMPRMLRPLGLRGKVERTMRMRLGNLRSNSRAIQTMAEHSTLERMNHVEPHRTHGHWLRPYRGRFGRLDVPCGKPIVAIRRWPEGDGESFGGVCQRHAKQAGAELVPLENVPQ